MSVHSNEHILSFAIQRYSNHLQENKDRNSLISQATKLPQTEFKDFVNVICIYTNVYKINYSSAYEIHTFIHTNLVLTLNYVSNLSSIDNIAA